MKVIVTGELAAFYRVVETELRSRRGTRFGCHVVD
jgi:hypothetical protein